MRPNVKFVSAIADAFSNKKMGVNFFFGKKTKPGGGGARGGFGKRPYFSRIFFSAPFPYMTRNQLRVAIECHKGVKVKVVKWC